MIFGEKTSSRAFLVSTGLGLGGLGGGLMVPVRIGCYYRGFYCGYFGQFYPILEYAGTLTHGMEVGYSIFFGRKPSEKIPRRSTL